MRSVFSVVVGHRALSFLVAPVYFASAATCILMIRSGLVRAGSPRLDLVDEVHALRPPGPRPCTGRSRNEQSSKQMKNCVLAEFGSSRARRADRAAAEGGVGEFGLQVGQVEPPRAGAGRVAALRHEAGDHAVEGVPS